MSTEMTTVWGQPPSEEEKMWALGAHLSNFIFPAVPSLIIYFLQKDKSKYISYHALQSAIMQGLFTWVISGAVISITCGLGFPILFVPMGLSIWHAIRAHNGEWVGFPMIEGFGK